MWVRVSVFDSQLVIDDRPPLIHKNGLQNFPRLYPELWKRLGCPESLGLHGQATYLTVVLGLEKRVPLHALRQVRGEMVAIRVLLAIAVVAFTGVAFMTG
ncbi:MULTISPECIES: hypothetical protein [unclassified Stenotrophomonas]|uniref:hypothetical protein n=1 Tax=unclassified Stenotrophomonas TaxID=196198 RepID=UPI0021C922ED|nr:hypothetical protein [Stenotrophomonas sp. Marseille-Q5258]